MRAETDQELFLSDLGEYEKCCIARPGPKLLVVHHCSFFANRSIFPDLTVRRPIEIAELIFPYSNSRLKLSPALFCSHSGRR
jgi:hypothetical protein